MSDINAAIGRAQFKKFNFFSKRRRELCKLYDKQFLSINRVKTFKRNFKEEVPHIYVVRIKNLKKESYLEKNYKHLEFKLVFIISLDINLLNTKNKKFFLIQKKYIKKS